MPPILRKQGMLSGSNEMNPSLDQKSSKLTESLPATPPSSHLPPSSRIPPFVLKAVSIASLGGILFGYDMGVVSGALPQLTETFSLTNSQREMVVSFLYLGGGVGAAAGGALCDATGRRTAILATDLIFALGAAVLFWARNLPTILIGRVVVGFAVSVSGVADVAYLHEISPAEWRGSVVSVNEACISLGFLLAYVAGYGIGMVDPEEGWRIMFGLSAAVALVQFLGMLGMPESPQWLMERGRTEEAEAALSSINGGAGWCGDAVDFEEGASDYHVHSPASSPDSCGNNTASEAGLGGSSPSDPINPTQPPENARPSYDTMSVAQPPISIRSSQPFMLSQSSFDDQYSPSMTFFSSWVAVVRTNFDRARHELAAHYRPAVIAVFLSVVQQFCGHTNVLNYAPEIFQQVGLASHQSSLGATLIIGVIKFIVTCLVIWKIEYLGRRFLLLFGMSTIALSLVLLSVAFAGNNGDDAMSTTAEYIAMFGCFGVALGYAASFGPLTWLLTSEMFPTSVRGRALGASTIITYLSACAVSYTFLTGQEMFGPAVPFTVYCIITTISVAFAALAIPDMGGRSPEEIEEEMLKMWWWKQKLR